MVSTISCAQCSGENPADAHFCIECGANLAQPATGATTKLPGPICHACQMPNPAGAHFCVACGHSFAPAQPATLHRPPTTKRLHRKHRKHYQHHQRMASHTPIYASPLSHPPRPQRHRSWGGFGWMLWSFTFLLLFWNGMIFPGILILLGLSMFSSGRRSHHHGIKVLLGIIGLVMLFQMLGRVLR